MKKLKTVVVLFVLGLSMVSCVWHSKSIPAVRTPPAVELSPLQRSEYEIIKTAEGHGCATFIGLFPVPIFFVAREQKGVDMWGFKTRSAAAEVALYNALESVSEGDAIIFPRYNSKSEYFLP